MGVPSCWHRAGGAAWLRSCLHAIMPSCRYAGTSPTGAPVRLPSCWQLRERAQSSESPGSACHHAGTEWGGESRLRSCHHAVMLARRRWALPAPCHHAGTCSCERGRWSSADVPSCWQSASHAAAMVLASTAPCHHAGTRWHPLAPAGARRHPPSSQRATAGTHLPELPVLAPRTGTSMTDPEMARTSSAGMMGTPSARGVGKGSAEAAEAPPMSMPASMPSSRGRARSADAIMLASSGSTRRRAVCHT